MYAKSAVSQYKQVNTHAQVLDADPHRLIAMLFDGALERIAYARGAMERKDVALKGEFIGKAIAIVGALQDSLDFEQGGEIARNLDSLYDYMQRRLLEANVQNDTAILAEVASLLQEIREGWNAIAPSRVMAEPQAVGA